MFSSRSTARAADAVGMEPRQVDAKGSCAREREPPQKASDDRFGGERTSHCDRDDGAVAPIADAASRQVTAEKLDT